MVNERLSGKTPVGLGVEVILQFVETVGKVMDALEANGLTGKTLVILASDNGPVLDDGYQDEAAPMNGDHTPGENCRGGQYRAFEAGTRVPFIVSWPGTVRSGDTSNALVSHIDLLADAAALINATVPLGAGIDSRNSLDTWLGRNTDDRSFAAAMAANRTLSLQSGQWKYIEPSNGAAKITTVNIETGYLATPQLYDLAADPGETTNVYSSRPAEAERMASTLAELRVPLSQLPTSGSYIQKTQEETSQTVCLKR